MKNLEVVGGILVKEGKILCAKRGIGKYDYISEKYEFPGGKIDPGENPKEALHRELIEELEIHISIENMTPFYLVEHQYPDFFVRMHCFLCKMSDEPIVQREHLDIQWRDLSTIIDLEWVPADLPVVEALIERGIEG
ncbi:MAG: (deoxy)nucleoside triphosphate pyrophosphohydrolase [Anaerovoracaceae bacterium]